MAKPSEADFNATHDFLRGIENHIEEGVHPDTRDDSDNDLEPLDEEWFLAWIHTTWGKVSCSWQRTLWAGKTAIDNACDPALTHLEFSPDILDKMALADMLIVAVRQWQSDGRSGFCLPVVGGELLAKAEEVAGKWGTEEERESAQC